MATTRSQADLCVRPLGDISIIDTVSVSSENGNGRCGHVINDPTAGSIPPHGAIFTPKRSDIQPAAHAEARRPCTPRRHISVWRATLRDTLMYEPPSLKALVGRGGNHAGRLRRRAGRAVCDYFLPLLTADVLVGAGFPFAWLWQRRQSATGNATLPWQTPHDSPSMIDAMLI